MNTYKRVYYSSIDCITIKYTRLLNNRMYYDGNIKVNTRLNTSKNRAAAAHLKGRARPACTSCLLMDTLCWMASMACDVTSAVYPSATGSTFMLCRSGHRALQPYR